MAATGADIANLSASEVAEGFTRLAAADALAARSDELVAAGVDRAIAGTEELAEAASLSEAARSAAAASEPEAAIGGAAIGAAAVEEAVAERLEERAR